MAVKRKNDAVVEEQSGKKLRLSDEEGASSAVAVAGGQSSSTKAQRTTNTESEGAPTPPRSQNSVTDNREKNKVDPSSSIESNSDLPGPSSSKKKPSRSRIRKLTPARPWPLVPTSVSATGPRSAHKDGKNMICITRKTGLGAYMRRCKDVILKDGYKVLHLSAMGAAIPLLLQLTCALPPILPFARDEVRTEVTTGTCEVQDEVLPDDDDEDISVQQRAKSTLLVVMTFGDGKFEGDTSGPVRRTGKNAANRPAGNGGQGGGSGSGKGKKKANEAMELVYAEPEQDELMDML
ncbi:hypothetical protein DFP72DRAFT_319834 [Ephemerocybe angulata]|uniref:Uncharacterized protein n=1 Tax=Ephemerocybe angulata TaxID=980116 RepID=A0A8H6IFI4_9AGAR|nr:hypothetical protein DFP72DRAFT_319834 [Tulosesus angulatus]